MTDKQKREVIAEALEGNQLKIRILRRKDVGVSNIGLSKEELDVPVYKLFRGRKRIAWIVEGDWKFNLNAILKHFLEERQIHFILTNYGIPMLGHPSNHAFNPEPPVVTRDWKC